MSYENIIVEKAEGIAKLTLNRPQAMNALTEKMMQEIVDALKECDRDDEVRVIIVTGAGKAFTAGKDVKEVASRPPGEYHPAPPVEDTIEAIDKPVIAAVNGYCGTGGFELALACDIIIASEAAIFADSHAKLGLVHAGGGSQRLPRLVGMKKAKEIILTSIPISGTEAERIGLANKVVPADKLMETATAMAKVIAGNSPVSVAIIKNVMNKGMKLDLAGGLLIETTEYRRHRERGKSSTDANRINTALSKDK
ncbi:MAG TPA: enoyl-CoA hydratase/isomerase family protein [Dehalococcoidales bacterium]|nr:enoyl-CoA hydratase/isomerase family protein [Dehalococcoidales bacterium]